MQFHTGYLFLYKRHTNAPKDINLRPSSYKVVCSSEKIQDKTYGRHKFMSTCLCQLSQCHRVGGFESFFARSPLCSFELTIWLRGQWGHWGHRSVTVRVVVVGERERQVRTSEKVKDTDWQSEKGPGERGMRAEGGNGGTGSNLTCGDGQKVLSGGPVNFYVPLTDVMSMPFKCHVSMFLSFKSNKRFTISPTLRTEAQCDSTSAQSLN